MHTRNLILLLFTLISFPVFGGGYLHRMQSVSHAGMGMTGAALKNGPASIFFNPGAFSFMDRDYEFSLGGAGLFKQVNYREVGLDAISEANVNRAFPFYFYGGIRLNKNLVFGMGIYKPFINSNTYTDNWSGRLMVQSQSVYAVYFQPTIAFKFTDRLSLGAGLVYAKANFNMQKGLPYGDFSSVELEGEASNIGYNIGVFFTPTEFIHMGMSYRSRIQLNVIDGHAIFHMPAVWNSILTDENRFAVSMPIPASLDYGMSFQIDDSFLFSVEFNWVMWRVFESLDFRFNEHGNLFDFDSPRRYKDVLATRVGAEFKLNESIRVRAGAFFEPNPADKHHFAADIVSLNTLGFTLGASLEPIDDFRIDFSYAQMFGLKSNVRYQSDGFSGSFSTQEFVPAIGISYRF
jgi:long-chain fatty acid transport protein